RAPAEPAPAAAAPEPAVLPPWEEAPVAVAEDAVVPQEAAPAQAVKNDSPPSWVEELIPDDAQEAYAPQAYTQDPDDDFETLAVEAPAPVVPRVAPPRAPRQSRARLSDMSAQNWPDLAARLPVTGLAAELARQSEWAGVQGDAVMLRVAVRTLAESESRVRLQTVLCEHFGQGLRLEIEVGSTGDATAHAVARIERAARQQAAEDAVAADPFVQALINDFGGHVVPGSVRAVEPPAA
ncbi:DNA polymerase III subunit gamma/tau C-terminal domain-containing protein, partial [Bordetella avium]|uniref:DNA polymerase III subunit gamma/tau C-terminal domain-containing protein n=1 Tax=Bordetella avium TaxID=521 RepID=UPI0039FCB9E2